MNKKVISALLCGAMVLGAATPVLAEGAGEGQKIAQMCIRDSYLAVDIGASSGRHILGHMENGKMVLEEVYRFENGMVKKGDELCWEFDRLFKEVINGLKKCKEIGKICLLYTSRCV